MPIAAALVPELLPEPALMEATLSPAPPVIVPPAAPIVAHVPVRPEPPIAAEKPKKGAACEKFGTRIVFLQNPPEAFKKASAENKQVFFVHLSGNFEDQEFT